MTPGEERGADKAGRPPARKGWQPPVNKPAGDAPRSSPTPRKPAPSTKPSAGPSSTAGTGSAAKPPLKSKRREVAAHETPELRANTRPLAGPPASAARVAARQRGAFRTLVRNRNTGPTFISRGERALFWILLGTVLAMAVYLVRYRERVDAHFEARAQVPLSDAATSAAPSPVTLLVADDDSGALTPQTISFPLPTDPGTRARVILEKLLTLYTLPTSGHPLKATPPGVGSVDEVFLSAVPGGTGRLATVDLTPEFVRLHPSGIEPETLTLLSMIATLHAALPSVTQVHFLVDGEPRATLAGHADLTQTYLASTVQMAQPVQFGGAR